MCTVVREDCVCLVLTIDLTLSAVCVCVCVCVCMFVGRAQLHTVLGLYAMSMNCMEPAEAQLNAALRVSVPGRTARGPSQHLSRASPLSTFVLFY